MRRKRFKGHYWIIIGLSLNPGKSSKLSFPSLSCSEINSSSDKWDVEQIGTCVCAYKYTCVLNMCFYSMIHSHWIRWNHSHLASLGFGSGPQTLWFSLEKKNNKKGTIKCQINSHSEKTDLICCGEKQGKRGQKNPRPKNQNNSPPTFNLPTM